MKRKRVGTTAVINNVAPDCIVDTLRAWFKSLPLRPPLDFDEHLLLYDVDAPPLAELADPHPLHHVAQLRYEYNAGFRELHVLTDPATFEYALAPYCYAAEHERSASVQPADYFYLTATGPHMDTLHWLSFHGQHISLGVLLEEALPRKVAQIVGTGSCPAPEANASAALMDCAASLMAALLGHWLEALHPPCANAYDGPAHWAHYHGKRFRTLYEHAREAHECTQGLATRLARFSSERLLLSLFDYNDMLPWLHAHCVEPSAADYRAYAQLWPDALYAPTHWLAVPCWEVPAPELLALPLHHHGTSDGARVHLPLYWRALLPWLQQRWRAFRDHSYAHWSPARDRARLPAVVRAALDEQAHALYRHYYDMHYAPPEVCIGKQPRAAGNSIVPINAAEPMVHLDVGDVEDIWALLPPCAAQVREQKRFPLNLERVRMATALWFGGVAEPAITRFFAHLNEMYPHKTETFERRFNVADTLRRAQEDPQKYQTYCKQTIRDTLTHEPNTLHCPYVAEARAQNAALADDDLRRACNYLCNGGKLFGGAPFRWVQNALRGQAKRRAHVAVVQEMAPPDDEYGSAEYMAVTDRALRPEVGNVEDDDEEDSDDAAERGGE